MYISVRTFCSYDVRLLHGERMSTLVVVISSMTSNLASSSDLGDMDKPACADTLGISKYAG